MIIFFSNTIGNVIQVVLDLQMQLEPSLQLNDALVKWTVSNFMNFFAVVIKQIVFPH